VAYKEDDRYNSGNPYAAAKAGGEEMVKAFANTYRIPCIITHTMNVFGERQHPEKFIPLTLKKVLDNETHIIHSNKDRTEAGSRYWIHARNVASALLFILKLWDTRTPETVCDTFNIVGEREVDNLEMAKTISKIVGILDPDTPRRFRLRDG
jgi:dTDP-glucose 4,6-dehydratase